MLGAGLPGIPVLTAVDLAALDLATAALAVAGFAADLFVLLTLGIAPPLLCPHPRGKPTTLCAPAIRPECRFFIFYFSRLRRIPETGAKAASRAWFGVTVASPERCIALDLRRGM
jgi:hypothetical protein